MSACSAVDFFGPRPNDQLVELSHQAQADSAGAEGDLAALRHEHAEELLAEIARLCGLDEAGNPPESCQVEEPEEALSPSPTPLGRYLEVVDDVPEESRDLLIDQAIDLAALDTSELPSTEVSDEDRALVGHMIEREHAAVHGLKSARAFASDPAGVDKLIERHQTRLLALQDTIPDPPVAGAGYTGGDITTGDEFIATEEDNLISAWRAAAADAATDESRALLIAAAADAITAYQELQ